MGFHLLLRSREPHDLDCIDFFSPFSLIYFSKIHFLFMSECQGKKSDGFLARAPEWQREKPSFPLLFHSLKFPFFQLPLCYIPTRWTERFLACFRYLPSPGVR